MEEPKYIERCIDSPMLQGMSMDFSGVFVRSYNKEEINNQK